jgi:hypothetical protein
MRTYFVEAPGGYTLYQVVNDLHVCIGHFLKSDGWTLLLIQQMGEAFEKKGRKF